MARDFVSCQRGQLLLMPPSLGEWLPEDDLVWTVLGAVDEMDLSRFTEAYRLGAAGRPAYDPAMMGRSASVRLCAREPVLARD
jgi:transposase